MVLKRKNTQIYPDIEKYIDIKQVVLIQNWRKVYLINLINITMRLYCSLAGYEICSLLKVQRQEVEFENGFLNCHVTSQVASNGHAYSLREIIIYYLPTSLYIGVWLV